MISFLPDSESSFKTLCLNIVYLLRTWLKWLSKTDYKAHKSTRILILPSFEANVLKDDSFNPYNKITIKTTDKTR